LRYYSRAMYSLPIMTDTQIPPPAPDAAHRGGGLWDQHGRQIRDLRLSVTDRCNFRCQYCMEPDVRFLPRMSLLTLKEYVRVADLFQRLGVTKIRLTGGEPTLFSALDELIDELGAMGFEDMAMTTNGSLVTPQRLLRWKRGGLRRLTFSLDSLDPERVAMITRSTTPLEKVLDAIKAAIAADLNPVKINAVIMRGVNDSEIPAFAELARQLGVDVRLIEFMPLDSARAWSRDRLVPARDVMEALHKVHGLEQMEADHAHSTSQNWRFTDGTPGRIGVIAPVTQPFCGACHRIRMTAEGCVRPCLFSDTEWDLRPLLRGGGTDEQIMKRIVDATWPKQAGHGITSPSFVQPRRTMSSIGG